MASLPQPDRARHRLLPDELTPSMAKADLRNPEEVWKRAIGEALRTVKGTLSLKEFARDLGNRDERQIARWLDGSETVQLPAVFAVAQFRLPLVLALAALADGVEIETVIRVRRIA